MKTLMKHLLYLSALLVLAGTAQADINPATAQKLLAADGVAGIRHSPGDRFGYSVSMSGDTVVIGAWGNDREKGAAYVFTCTDGVWSQQQKLTADDGTVADEFGWSVSVAGDTAIIGAMHAKSAYVFMRTDGVWSQQQKLTAADRVADDGFCSSVSLSSDGGIALIGATKADSKGSAYIFTRTADGTWSQQQKLTPRDGAADDWFGDSVSVSANTAVIGAFGNDGKKGAVYIFTRAADGVWTQQQKLTAADGAVIDYFGKSVSVSANTAVIGAFGNDGGKGSAYIFTRADGVWSQQQKLIATTDHMFGVSVSVDGDKAVVGAIGDDNKKGSAYVFTRTGGVWSQQQKLTAADGASGDWFGESISVSGDTVAVGASYNDGRKGAAYIFAGAAKPNPKSASHP